MLICQDTPYSEKMKLMKTPVYKLMLRNRFGKVMQNLYLADNSCLHEYDKFSQVIAFFAETSFCCNIQEKVCIDEYVKYICEMSLSDLSLLWNIHWREKI